MFKCYSSERELLYVDDLALMCDETTEGLGNKMEGGF